MSRSKLREKYVADVIAATDALPRPVRSRLAIDDDLRDLYHALVWLSADAATERDLSWMRRRP